MKISVVRADGSELPHLVHNGTPYILAESGESFRVRFSRGHGDRLTTSVKVRCIDFR